MIIKLGCSIIRNKFEDDPFEVKIFGFRTAIYPPCALQTESVSCLSPGSFKHNVGRGITKVIIEAVRLPVVEKSKMLNSFAKAVSITQK